MHWSLLGPLTALEVIIVSFALLAALLLPARTKRALFSFGRTLRRRLLARPFLGLALFATAWNFAPLLVYVPVPNAHDEFGFLLIADTLLEGRLANPTHPMWHALETFHVIHVPTYAAKYPAFHGAVLAVGQLTTGLAVVGSKLFLVLASLTSWWALRGWLPPRHAMFGAVLFTLHFGGFAYWSQTHFPGAGAAVGGALVLGAIPRLRHEADKHLRASGPRDAVLLGIGLSILATTRPYEGLVLALPLCLWLVWGGRSEPAHLVRDIWPTILIGAAALASIGYYNYSVTGDVLVFPYQVYTEQYGYGKPFRFQLPNTNLHLRHEVMQRFLDFEKLGYAEPWTTRWHMMTRFYVAPLVLPILLFVPALLRHNRSRGPTLLGLVSLASLTLSTFVFPHYASPFAVLLVLLLVQCLRLMAVTSFRGKALGRRLHRFTLTAWLVFWLVGNVLTALVQSSYDAPGLWHQTRERIRRELAQTGDEHLVFVRYGPDHSAHEEWVYNRANIDAAPVVWAREQGEADDEVVSRYFSDRHVWRIEPDREGEIILVPVRTRESSSSGPR